MNKSLSRAPAKLLALGTAMLLCFGHGAGFHSEIAFAEDLQPTIAIISPTAGSDVGRSVNLGIALKDAENFRVMGMRVNVCRVSDSCTGGMDIKPSETLSLGTGLASANSIESIQFVQQPGTYQIYVGYSFFALKEDSSQYPSICNSIRHHLISCFSHSQTITLTFSDSGESLSVPIEKLSLDPRESNSFRTELNLKCTNNSRKKRINCTVNPVVRPDERISAFRNHLVTGSIPIDICVYKEDLVRDPCDELEASKDPYQAIFRDFLPFVQLNTTTAFSVPSTEFLRTMWEF